LNIKKLNITLVNPLYDGNIDYFPTGLCYLSSYLKKHLNDKITIKIINQSEISADMILACNPDLVGFTAFSHTFGKATKLAEIIKSHLPETPLLLGGCHISMIPESLPSVFDYGVIGEGEQTFLKYIKNILNRNQKENAHLNGLYSNENAVGFQRATLIEDLDTIPFPDRLNIDELETIIKSEHPGWFNRTGLRYTQLTTSRGCPYKCVFCQPSVMWKKYRMHSPAYIAEEIAYVQKMLGINAILIEDDLFTGNKKRVAELIEHLGKKNLSGKIIYYVAARASQIDEEWVQLLKELGVVKVEFGIESGSDEIAKYLKGSKSSVEINKHAINLLNRSGIGVFASFIAGSPPEKAEDLEQTFKMIKWIKKNHSRNSCGIGIATALPGTGLWEHAVSKGLIDINNFDWELVSTLKKFPENASEMIYLNEHIPAELMLKKIKQLNFRLKLGTPGEFIKAIPRRMKKLVKRIFNS